MLRQAGQDDEVANLNFPQHRGVWKRKGTAERPPLFALH
jgi:hypothetical protein